MSKTSDYLVAQIEERDQTIQSFLTQFIAMKEKCFDEGWHAHFEEREKQKSDPTHPITDTNPYRTKEHN